MKSFTQFLSEAPKQPKFGKIKGTALYRKPSTLDEVEQWAETHTQTKVYTIFEVIDLNGAQWRRFKSRPLQDAQFLKDSNAFLKTIMEAGLLTYKDDPAVIVMCTDEESEHHLGGVIVDTQGSDYARYVALSMEEGEPSLFMNPPIVTAKKDVLAFIESQKGGGELPTHLL